MSRAFLRVVASSPVKKVQPFDPSRRGYVIAYRQGETNHCPGCDRTSWIIGRMSAECGFCGTALPLGREAAHG